MKKEINDLLVIYHEEVAPNIDLNEIKKALIFKKKHKFRFKVPAIIMAALLLIIMVPITFNALRSKTEPIKPEVLETLYIQDNQRMLKYVKNHFTFYLDQSVYRVRLDEDTVLTLYYAIEDDFDYLIYEVESTKEKSYTLSFINKNDLTLLKESSYELEHFFIPSRYMDLEITYKMGEQTKVFDVSIRR